MLSSSDRLCLPVLPNLENWDPLSSSGSEVIRDVNIIIRKLLNAHSIGQGWDMRLDQGDQRGVWSHIRGGHFGKCVCFRLRFRHKGEKITTSTTDK